MCGVHLNTEEQPKNFHFKVLIDGRHVPACTKISALRQTSQVLDVREGGDAGAVRTSPGVTSHDPIIIEAGVTHDLTFERWANQVRNHGASAASGHAKVMHTDFHKDIRIELYDEAGALAIAYRVFRCWPSEFQALPSLEAASSAATIMHVKLENDGWTRETPEPPPA